MTFSYNANPVWKPETDLFKKLNLKKLCLNCFKEFDYESYALRLNY